MHCKHCGFGNGEDDHRCLRCGRRLTGVVNPAPVGYSGANALAMAPVLQRDVEFEPVRPEVPGQAGLFGHASPDSVPGKQSSPKVIVFDQWQRQQRPPSAAAHPAAAAPAQTASPRKPARPTVEQGKLDFIPALPARARKLKTDVDAQVFCDQPVATPAHRCVASAIDGAFILIGFGLLVLIVEMMGGSFGVGKMFWMGLGATFLLVSIFYGLIWAIAGRETAGMRFTDLELITFDGFPLDARSRALRFASSWLSFCSGGLGLFWAVADEENLTWHDHISKTFPTIREEPRSFVKQRG